MRAILNKLRALFSELSLEQLGDFHKDMAAWAVIVAVGATALLIPYLIGVLLMTLLTGALSANPLILAVWAGIVGLAALSIASLKLAQIADRMLE